MLANLEKQISTQFPTCGSRGMVDRNPMASDTRHIEMSKRKCIRLVKFPN